MHLAHLTLLPGLRYDPTGPLFRIHETDTYSGVQVLNRAQKSRYLGGIVRA